MPKTTTKERPWRRIGSPEEGFHYLRGDGAPLKSKAALERIRKLVIPPAWTGVEISPDPAAKVQVTGIDKAGRKQYRYNAEFTAKRSKSKYRKLLDLARCIPHLREVTDEHLKRKGVGRERVLATVVRLMMRGAFRVGSERYVTENKTFGLATLRKNHLRIEGQNLVFRYRGKKAVHQRQVVADTPLVEVIREIMELPGPRLFKFRGEDGKTYPVTAKELNDYIKEVLGKRFTSKDLRTWGGTVRAATVLAEPIDRFGASVVFHGHAHHGTFHGKTAGGVPVYNVSLSLIRQEGKGEMYFLYDIPIDQDARREVPATMEPAPATSGVPESA